MGATRFGQHSRIRQWAGTLRRRPIDARSHCTGRLEGVCRSARSDAVKTLSMSSDPKHRIEGRHARQSSARRRLSEFSMVPTKRGKVLVF